MANSKRTSVAKRLGLLLKSHYLADDFPNVITTDQLAAFCVRNYGSLETVKALLGRTTLSGTFSAPRSITTRRVLALPHPSSQLALSCLIVENRTAIRKAIDSSKITLYNTKQSSKRERAFIGIDFRAREEKEAEILASYPVIMTADVANFFHTIYSHSLPWAVLGKQRVKDIREKGSKKARERLENHWASQIDVAIQRSNSRETFGIPVGPDTSRIIADILLSGIHKDATFSAALGSRLAYRLVDDFFIGFEDEGTARKCQDALRRALWEYNLHLNETKTRIFHTASLFEDGWRYEMDHFSVPEHSPASQREALQHLLEMALRYCEIRQDSQPATFFCGRVLTLNILEENIPFALQCMLRMARDFTTCLKFLAEFVIEYGQSFRTEHVATIKQWSELLLRVHAPRSHDFEICWVLILCGLLRLRVDLDFVALEDRPPSPVVLALLGLLGSRGLLAERWDAWTSSVIGSGSIALGRYWLPFYEATHRGWTNNARILKEIRTEPLFARLLKANVSFLDDSVFPIPSGPTQKKRPTPRNGRKQQMLRRVRSRSARGTSGTYD